jgi:hypothetical protein
MYDRDKLAEFLCHCADAVDGDGEVLIFEPVSGHTVSVSVRYLVRATCAEKRSDAART